MRYIVKWSALLAVALVMSLAAFAQQGGALQGKISDEAGQPVIGAMIQVTGASLQGFQGAATDTNGQYAIPSLPVGSGYQVKVEAPGYNSVIRKGIAIQLGVTVNLPFTLSQGKTEIVITAAAPIIDSRKTEVGANISDKMIQAIPLGRNSDTIAFLAPGAVTSGLANTPSFGGASGPENSYTVNGIEVTGSGDALNLTQLNFDFIESTEVKTGGMDAEYGALMGGNVNSITKSGGNEFHGSLFMYYFDDGLGAKERKLNNDNIVNYRTSFKQYDVGGSLGGYFIKDKLWFFVAYDYNKTETGWSANGYDASVELNGKPSYSYHYGSPYKNTETDPQYAAKLTWNISPDHKLSFTWFGDNDKFNYFRNLNNVSAVASPTTQKTDNYALSLAWNATWTPKFFTEAIISRRNTTESVTPNNTLASNSYGYYYRYGSGTYAGEQIIPVGMPNVVPTAANDYNIDLSSWAPSLGARTFEQTHDRNDQIRLKGTNLFNALGRHELSYGFQSFDINYDYNFNYTGPSLTEMNPTDPFYGHSSPGGAIVRWGYSASSPSHYLFRAQSFMSNENKKTTQKYTAYWAQDNWNLTDYFMFKVGLRLDQIHMAGSPNTINVPSEIPGVVSPTPGMQLANGQARHVNINDEWAPRIGFTWDVAHNNKSKLYGFWGQYYERIPNDMAIRALTDEYMHQAYYYDAALTTPRPTGGGYPVTYGLNNTLIKGGPNGGNLKGSYNEECILGFQYEVAPDFTVGVRGIYRNLGRVIEDISVDGATTYQITNPDAWTNVWVADALGRYQMLPGPIPGGHDGIPDLNHPYQWKFPKPVRQYRALELTAEKRFSNHWMMQGSYVLSRLDGNYEGLFSNDNGQLDPNITSKYDIPSLLVNGYGLLPNDRTHVLHVFGGYFFDNIPLQLSGNFQMQSGIPISALGADDAYGLNEGFAKVRGTAGRTPTIWALDIGAQYTFPIWKSNLALRADIFNVTNEQRTTTVDETYNTVDTQPTQNYANFKRELTHQVARRIRLALRWTF